MPKATNRNASSKLMKKFEAAVTENKILKQELDETKKMHQQNLDELKQELGNLKQENLQQREMRREANEANENLQRVCDLLKAEQKRIEVNVDIQKSKLATSEKKYSALQTTVMKQREELETHTIPLPLPPFYFN